MDAGGIISSTMAALPRVVLDTNVLVAGLRSRRGASFRLLSEVDRGKFEMLPDPKDDLVLELAVAAGCKTVVTFNVRDFRGAEGLAVRAQRPADFLRAIGVLS